MDNIEQTLERLIANWDQLHMNGTIDLACTRLDCDTSMRG